MIARLFEEPLKVTEGEKSKFQKFILNEHIHLKFQVVKGPSYGLYALNDGTCIATDVKLSEEDEERLWEKKEFYLLAMIDEITQQAIGFVHLFEKDIDWNIHLTTPGIEPTTEILGQVSASELYLYIEEALEVVEYAGGFHETNLPAAPNILSNRKDIYDIIVKKNYPQKELKDAQGTKVIVQWNTLPYPYPFSDVYVLPKRENRELLLQLATSPKSEKNQNHLPETDNAMIIEEERNATAKTSKEEKPLGGINLSPDIYDMQIRRDESGTPLPIHQQPTQIQNFKISGLFPVIINITPVTNLPLILGINEEKNNFQISYLSEP